MLKFKNLIKKNFFKKNIILLIFFLLFSFLFGNIFGLNFEFFFVKYSNFLFFLIPISIEIINFLNFVLSKKFKNTKLNLIFISIRRGFFLGIFIEAFKLGS